jgi:ATP-binding cassette subfamily C protein CydCD
VKPLDPRLLRYSRSSRGFLTYLVALSTIGAIATITQAFLLTTLIVSFFQKHQNFWDQRSPLTFLALVFIFRAGISYLSDRISAAAAINIRNELRSAVLKKVLSNEGRDTNELGTAGLSLLLTKGIGNLDSYFSRFIPQLFIAGIVPVLVGVIIAVRDIRSGIIILLTIPLIPLFGILIGKFTASATSKKWQTLNLLGGYFLDLLNGLTTLRVYGRHKAQNEKLQKVGDDYRKETMKVLKISFLSSLALELVATLSIALLAVTIGLRLVSGSITLEIGLFILIIAPEVYWPIRQVATFFHAASDGIAAFDSIFKILDRPSSSGGRSVNQVFAITWSQLTVAYPNRTELHIPSGQVNVGNVHALVGASGTGKSTLAAILLGFVRPTYGEILISTDSGSIPMSEVDIESLRAKLSWLPQEPRFPVGTVAQILRHAKPVATDFELIEVLTKVDLDIKDLPNGLSTELGSIKQPLSFGQQRKIALARALLKPAQFIILDEPTASVDDVSEATIRKVIKDESSSGKGILLISHRNSLLLDSDQITDMARAR